MPPKDPLRRRPANHGPSAIAASLGVCCDPARAAVALTARWPTPDGARPRRRGRDRDAGDPRGLPRTRPLAAPTRRATTVTSPISRGYGWAKTAIPASPRRTPGCATSRRTRTAVPVPARRDRDAQVPRAGAGPRVRARRGARPRRSTFPDVDPSTAVVALRGDRGGARMAERAPGGAVRSRRRRDDARRASGARARARPGARGAALDRLHTRDGERFDTAAELRHDAARHAAGAPLQRAERVRVASTSAPTDVLSRAQVAFSLYRATTQPSWNVAEPAGRSTRTSSCRTSARGCSRSCGGGSATSATPTSGAASGASSRTEPSGARWPAALAGSTARASRGGCCARTTAAPGTSRPPRPYRGWTLAAAHLGRHGAR